MFFLVLQYCLDYLTHVVYNKSILFKPRVVLISVSVFLNSVIKLDISMDEENRW